jgi:S-adenosylmethionine synthetase
VKAGAEIAIFSTRATFFLMSQRALVTGGTGLLGRAVVKSFRNAGWNVTGTGFSRASPPDILKLDVLDKAEIARVLDEVQ